MINYGKIKSRIGKLRNVYYSDPMFSNDLGVSLKTIHNWKKGKTQPNLSQLIKMKELCNFNSLDDLL